jgi:NAD(P)-dependent dehydrogenase (short-subunit alcohol dehydrogenase family)
VRVFLFRADASRAGSWEEMAGPVMLFATTAGAYLNGSNILIDGGWSMVSGIVRHEIDIRTRPPRMFEPMNC